MIFKQSIKKHTGNERSVHFVTEWVKKDLGYRYKRSWSRSLHVKDPKLKYIQSIFAVRTMMMLDDERVQISVDESNLNNKIRCNYTWLPKGRSSGIANTFWRGSAQMIWAMSISVNLMWIICSGTTNSKKFWIFLMLLKKFIEIWTQIKAENVVITMDNTVIHHSKITLKAVTALELKILLLPPYSPSLAPVEWVFGICKKKLAATRKWRLIDFEKRYGRREIAEILLQIDRTMIMRIWVKFLEEAKSIILNVLHIRKLIQNWEEKVEEIGERQ